MENLENKVRLGRFLVFLSFKALLMRQEDKPFSQWLHRCKGTSQNRLNLDLIDIIKSTPNFKSKVTSKFLL